MEDSNATSDEAAAILAASVALIDLRDALNELSLALRDWQFDSDMEQRRAAEAMTRQLLQQAGIWALRPAGL